MKNSKCFVPHGHNEFVKVYLASDGDNRLDGISNMSNQFETLKKSWHNWIDNAVDHSMQLTNKDPMLDYFKNHEAQNLKHLLITPGDPTTEVLAACFFAKINAFMKHDGLKMRCIKLEIEETPTNTVIFYGDPEKAISMEHYQDIALPWWQRPDMSINDL